MPTAYARTNGNGNQLWGDIDLSNIKHETQISKEENPWNKVCGKGEVWDFEDFMQDRTLDKYDLLVRYAMRVLDIKENPKEITVVKSKYGKMIVINGHSFLHFRGKIYQK